MHARAPLNLAPIETCTHQAHVLNLFHVVSQEAFQAYLASSTNMGLMLLATALRSTDIHPHARVKMATSSLELCIVVHDVELEGHGDRHRIPQHQFTG